METKLSRRNFLKVLGAGAISLVVPKLVFAEEQEGTLEGLLHKSLTPEVREWLPANLDLEVVESMEREENGNVSLIGRFLRTYRWDKILSYCEEKCNIEGGLLAGIVMHESYGNPFSLGPTNDVGLWMFIPRTAKLYHLRIGAKSNEELKRLIETHNHDYQKLTEIDDRFDIFKSTEAAVRLLINLKAEYGNNNGWDSVISAYNEGSPVQNPSSTKYVQEVRYWQSIYLKQKGFIQQLKEGRITPETLEQLKELNRTDFRLDKEGNICFYTVIDRDNPGIIAEKFNRKYRNIYQKITWEQFRYNGKPINPNRIIPGQVLNWNVVPKT